MPMDQDDLELAELLGLTVLPDRAVPALSVELGALFRRRRQNVGLSVADVAAAAGLTEDELFKVENGHREVWPRELPALAWALDMTMGDIIATWTTVRTPNR